MKGAAGSGVVAQDELVRLPDLDVKVFDTCDMLEAYLQTYSKTYISDLFCTDSSTCADAKREIW
ncbi:hypothetical protein PF007_g20349 [Phytophthora fragariae]|uniref:Uncharacterized protein n=1 Tax=Phytophthora fragariae TaxID=53985 RepID=A0A6A3R1U1_9STRA|nr:hypothetical protein PF003_g935 [Phytophthora fragariae]KAE8929021.1 hypothetical protein PF009_g20854 [Phytophthora fragariae]KAE9087509.1 hypothetical protein PF007_g20349 [Phytophthora fragariae]